METMNHKRKSWWSIFTGWDLDTHWVGVLAAAYSNCDRGTEETHLPLFTVNSLPSYLGFLYPPHQFQTLCSHFYKMKFCVFPRWKPLSTAGPGISDSSRSWLQCHYAFLWRRIFNPRCVFVCLFVFCNHWILLSQKDYVFCITLLSTKSVWI